MRSSVRQFFFPSEIIAVSMRAFIKRIAKTSSATAFCIFSLSAVAAWDGDRDNDGVLNGDDAFPDVSMGLLVDTDRDGRPDECDAACEQRGMTADDDDDGDGIADSDDLYPLISLRRTEAVQLGLDIPYRGRLQMSADGLTIVISDPNEGSNDLNNNGAVRVFRYIDGAWDQMGDTIVGANEADYAGWGVALSEDGSSLGVGFPGEATFREMTMVSFVFIPGMVPPGSSGK